MLLTQANSGRPARSFEAARQWLLVAAVIPIAAVPPAMAQGRAAEYHVKAAFLLNFARFVEWPFECMPASSSPLVIGVVGADPFGGELQERLRGRFVEGHPIQLRHLQWNEPLTECHILFISASEREHLLQILLSVRRKSVLTVSDMERFCLGGGMIELVMVGDRVRFDIHWNAAVAANLKVSAKLLSVARVVRNGTVEERR